MKRVVLGCVLLTACMTGCGDRADKTPPVAKGAPPAATPKPQPPPPAIDMEKTRSLFARNSAKQLGDVEGRVEMRVLGILIHPGVNTATSAQFKLRGKINALTLAGFIAPLPPEAMPIVQAGTVSLQLQADGRALETLTIDRYTPFVKRLDLQGAAVLTVTVGNADGKAWFDWFILGVVGQD